MSPHVRAQTLRNKTPPSFLHCSVSFPPASPQGPFSPSSNHLNPSTHAGAPSCGSSALRARREEKGRERVRRLTAEGGLTFDPAVLVLINPLKEFVRLHYVSLYIPPDREERHKSICLITKTTVWIFKSPLIVCVAWECVCGALSMSQTFSPVRIILVLTKGLEWKHFSVKLQIVSVLSLNLSIFMPRNWQVLSVFPRISFLWRWERLRKKAC